MQKPMNKHVNRLGLIDGLAAAAVGHRLRRAADEIGDNRRILAFYLADMRDRGLYLESGHGSVEHFGEAQLEIRPRRTREYIQVGRALRGLELVDQAFDSRAIGWSKVVALLPVVQRETQKTWVDFARNHTWRELRDEELLLAMSEHCLGRLPDT